MSRRTGSRPADSDISSLFWQLIVKPETRQQCHLHIGIFYGRHCRAYLVIANTKRSGDSGPPCRAPLCREKGFDRSWAEISQNGSVNCVHQTGFLTPVEETLYETFVKLSNSGSLRISPLLWSVGTPTCQCPGWYEDTLARGILFAYRPASTSSSPARRAAAVSLFSQGGQGKCGWVFPCNSVGIAFVSDHRIRPFTRKLWILQRSWLRGVIRIHKRRPSNLCALSI